MNDRSIVVGRTLSASPDQVNILVDRNAEERLLVGDVVEINAIHPDISSVYGLLTTLRTAPDSLVEILAQAEVTETDVQGVFPTYAPAIEAIVSPVAYKTNGAAVCVSPPPVLIKSLKRIKLVSDKDLRNMLEQGFDYLRPHLLNATMMSGHALAVKRLGIDWWRDMAKYLLSLATPEALNLLSIFSGDDKIALPEPKTDNLGRILYGKTLDVTLSVPSEPILNDALEKGSFIALDENSGSTHFGIISEFEIPQVTQLPDNTPAWCRELAARSSEYLVQVMLEKTKGRNGIVKNVSRAPASNSTVRLARQDDISSIFGDPDGSGNFTVGTVTGEGELNVALPLQKLLQGSWAFLGATGSGKSWTFRTMAAGVIANTAAKNINAAMLVFDMHSGAPRSI